MNCAHLFNGIGGFALAASWMGWNNVMHCEIDPFCNKVMNHHFPNSHQYGDIKTADFSIWRNRIDLLTGGFPCQPYSQAGKRQGKEDDRHLWPFMLTAIRAIQPRWIVGENVSGLLSWNGGMVFDEVQFDLEAAGYEVIPFLFPACAVNAPHRRDRIWFVAYAESLNRCVSNESEDRQEDVDPDGIGQQTNATNAEGFGQRKQSNEINTITEGWEARIEPSSTNWDDFPTQSPVCGGNDGFPTGLANITFSKWRNEGLKALGNAIVPKAAFQIFKAIDAFNKTTTTT